MLLNFILKASIIFANFKYDTVVFNVKNIGHIVSPIKSYILMYDNNSTLIQKDFNLLAETFRFQNQEDIYYVDVHGKGLTFDYTFYDNHFVKNTSLIFETKNKMPAVFLLNKDVILLPIEGEQSSLMIQKFNVLGIHKENRMKIDLGYNGSFRDGFKLDNEDLILTMGKNDITSIIKINSNTFKTQVKKYICQFPSNEIMNIPIYFVCNKTALINLRTFEIHNISKLSSKISLDNLNYVGISDNITLKYNLILLEKKNNTLQLFLADINISSELKHFDTLEFGQEQELAITVDGILENNVYHFYVLSQSEKDITMHYYQISLNTFDINKKEAKLVPN